MALDLSKLTDAVTKVAGLAAENATLRADAQASQDAVDALTASLIAATTSPAGAVGLAAVADALVAPVYPPLPLTGVLPPVSAPADMLANLK